MVLRDVINHAGNVGLGRDNGHVTVGIAQEAIDGPDSAGQAVRARLLGPFAITAGDRAVGAWPRPSARRLCQLLLVSPDRRVTRDHACDELFPRLEPRAAARALSKALSMARATLAELGEPGTALLGADLTHIWLAPAIVVDADAQIEALHAGLALSAGQDRDDRLSAALADDGELLPDEPYADWAAPPRDRLSALRQEARLALARDRAKGAGRSGPDDVTAAWLSCLDHDPACEEAAGALIRGYLADGRPEQAARVFERCRAALEELGLRISPSLQRIYAVAATRDRAATPIRPAAAQSGQVPPAASAPSPGLASVATPPAPVTPAPASSGPASPGPASPAPVSPASGWLPRTERRPVSVLFAEVAAPAGLAGALGLEELRDLVGGSLAAVIAEVEALGGLVTSVSGRGLQAMFGAPEAHEDDPERAVRAAFRALTATAAVGTAPGGTADAAGLALRIGVESGPAVVGPIGGGAKVEYTALGEVVSVAAALQSAARPGSVLVGPATRTVTGHLFSWGTQEKVTPEPGAAPLVASYLDAPRPTAAERLPRLGGRAPLAGRQAELRLVEGALREAVARRGGVVVLTGEPGLGKTRLVQEARKRFIAWVGAGSGRLPLWLEGRGVSYASATPYGVYRELVAGWIGVSPDQPPATIRAALADALTRLMGNTNLLVPFEHLMGLQPADAAGATTPGAGSTGTPGRRMGPEEVQRQTFAAMRALVSRFAAVAPTVVVLEDLHWADPTSLRLTAELAELTASRPLLMIATTRPGAGPAIAGLSARPSRQIRLRPLSVADAEALAMSLIGKVGGQQLLSAALASAEGNPLFLEERLAEMLETGSLVREQGSWWLREPAGPPSGAVLPLVLERLVRSRVDRLSPAASEAIRAAAVLGTEFTASLLAATLGTEPAALGPVLDELCDSDLVHPGSPERRSSFLFRHALIQEATYLALLRAERRDLHARAARAIESAAAGRLPEVAGLLGRHYAAAELAESAVSYLELAGDQATGAFANDEAIASFREAIAVAERAGGMVPDAVRLHAKLANVLWRVVRHDEAGEAFRAALRLADASQLDPLLRAHLHTRLGRLDMAELRYEAAEAEFDLAEALLGDDPAAWNDATADQWLEMMVDGRADLHQMRLKPDLALAALEKARPVLEARGGPARETVFYRISAMLRISRNRMRVEDEDIAALRRSIEVAERTGEDKDLGYAMDFLGWALWLRGDLPEAAEQLEKALALAERIGETFLRDIATLALTLTALRRHDTETVRTLLPRVLAAGNSLGGRVTGGVAGAAWLAWQDGRPGEVIRLSAEVEARDLTTIGSGAQYRWVYLFPLIAARLQADELVEAVVAARRMLDPSQQFLSPDLMAALTEACTAWDDGDQATARRHLVAALDLARAHAYF